MVLIKEVNLNNIKGELILVVSANLNDNIQEKIEKNEALKLINEMGIKKAYQVIKTKYKISRNNFYKFAMDIKND